MLVEGNISAAFKQNEYPTTDFRLGEIDVGLPNPKNTIRPVRLPGRYTNEIRDVRFDRVREVPAVMLREAHLFSGHLSDSDVIEDPDALLGAIENDIKIAKREHNRLAEEIIPHLDWGNVSLLDILIYDQNSPRKVVNGTNFDHNYAYEIPESDDALDFRRSTRLRGLQHAISYVQEGSLLDRYGEALSRPDSQSKITALREAAETDFEIDNPEPTELSQKTQQAKLALEAGVKTDDKAEKSKVDLINLALDLAIESMDQTPDDRPASLDRIAALQVAARAVHELSMMPGSFELYMSEHEAREFRVRALELASAWMSESVEIQREFFGQPIGRITAENVRDVQNNAQTLQLNSKLINDSFWYDNIYRDDYNHAVEQLQPSQSQVARIGSLAVTTVIEALKMPIEENDYEKSVAA